MNKFQLTAKQIFETAFSQVDRTIAYKPAWANGTGYMDNIVQDTTVGTLGEILAFTDVKNRKGIVTVTPWGNLVVFQRYSDGANDTYVSNGPDMVTRILDLKSAVSADQMCAVFNNGDNFQMHFSGFCRNLIDLVGSTSVQEFTAMRAAVDALRSVEEVEA